MDNDEQEQAIADTAEEVQSVAASDEPVAPKIPATRIIASKRFSGKYNRDLLTALLTEDSYTISEAEKILDDFMGVE
ncbi:hypothetical protein [Pelosinus propionicus]|uniref:Uncharacterized protein n=1 Tax=Pelosinus propionicus DSM 13327 TaxID=1123291 RepID=A0A1I4QBX2_9FIRM|nr:hypothetical protein [Pelosinus propionicus]SFM37601.1 hypothetical protein SAMN04490355_10944 [Pelosinus propionicus DSM 13327]